MIRGDRVLPHTIVGAQACQLDVLRTVDPRLPPRALVAGGPCLDLPSDEFRVVLTLHANIWE